MILIIAFFVIIRIILVNFVCKGILQFALSLFAAVVLCPLISASVFLGKLIYFSIHSNRLLKISLPKPSNFFFNQIIIICLVGSLKFFIRTIWDEAVFQIFIKTSCSVPSMDTIAVKRMSGPGFSQNFHYLITTAQALAALKNKAEIEILETWQRNMEILIEAPKNDFIQVLSYL